MTRQAQALADALAGNVRLSIPREEYTQMHVRNLLAKSGVPVIWERTALLRAERGTLTSEYDAANDRFNILWKPPAARLEHAA